MTKSRKLAFWSVVAVTVLSALVLGTLALRALTDSDHLKQIARDQVRTVWSRELTVEKLSVSFTPMPQFHGTDVSVSNPAWAHERVFLEAKDVNARVEFFPLLIGRIVIDRLSVNGFTLHLQHGPDGRKNWDTPTPSGPLPVVGAARSSLVRISPSAITLDNGTIDFRNRDDVDRTWKIERAELDAGAGWRDVTLDCRLSRDGHAVQVDGKLDDMRQFGTQDAIANGSLRVRAGSASLTIAGQLPLDPALQRYHFKAAIEGSLAEAYAFLGTARHPPLELKASVKLQAAGGVIDANDLQLQLGKLHLAGDARITKRGDVPVFDARLSADRLDWVQTLLDAGQPALPPKPAGELFYDNTLPWRQLAATAGVEGTLRVNAHWLKLRSGVELTDVAGNMKFAAGRLNVTSFSAKLLAGSATGSALLDGSKQTAQVDLHLADTLLGTWFLQTHKHVALVGGPMQVHARVSADGRSMKELAASLTGPVTISIGPAKLYSKKLSETETLLTGLAPFFSAKGADQVDLSCIGARLSFERGIARGDHIVGVRSDASQLLTSGSVDLRRQSIDLRGPIRARAGIALGVSTFASKVIIDGKIAAPSVGLDKAGAPGAIARVAAAIFTGGASIIGTTLWDGARAAPNPCQVALATTSAAPRNVARRDQPAGQKGK